MTHNNNIRGSNYITEFLFIVVISFMLSFSKLFTLFDTSRFTSIPVQNYTSFIMTVTAIGLVYFSSLYILTEFDEFQENYNILVYLFLSQFGLFYIGFVNGSVSLINLAVLNGISGWIGYEVISSRFDTTKSTIISFVGLILISGGLLTQYKLYALYVISPVLSIFNILFVDYCTSRVRKLDSSVIYAILTSVLLCPVLISVLVVGMEISMSILVIYYSVSIFGVVLSLSSMLLPEIYLDTENIRFYKELLTGVLFSGSVYFVVLFSVVL